ncbi:tripartite tricarboxylate transporter TctB family protein [Ammoniphilus resinae]|uniref:Tricarboxylic transport membrane protein n=1 Tax=Ammoniphilus resinae TaxID=861532 RepID=A0ABS4GL13_9BACL|nr:putative tricarboxylic transport membrane protein [Ammoniphilus resinae]
MNKTFDRYASIAFLAIGILFIIESRKITASAYGSEVGPNIFPLGLGLVLVVLSLRLLYETFKYQQTEKRRSSLDYKRFGIIFVAAFVYCYFLEDIGYVLSTFLFLLIGFQTMQQGKIWSSILISGGFSFGVYYLFVEVLKGSLPGLPTWLGLS